MDQDDPPLFAALSAFHGIGPRHELREDRMSYRDQPVSRVEARYGADDTPGGPPSPPLDEPAMVSSTDWPARPVLTDPVAPDVAICPCCGTAVHPDRIRD